MITNILDILYTPIDAPDVPSYNRQDLDIWCIKNCKQIIADRRDGSKTNSEDIYPWNIVYARNEYRWVDNFNIKFPELANYFSSIFLLTEREISSILLLPVKSHYTGTTYWHADPDETGLRLYLENNETELDFLLLKPTQEKLNARKDLGIIPANGISPKVQNVVYSAKILKPKQAFYLNNVRAIHAVNVEVPNLKRLAVLVITKLNAKNFNDRTKNLILKSAEKFPDYVIKWSPPH